MPRPHAETAGRLATPLGGAWLLLGNAVRIALSALYTGVVSGALLAVIYPRYWYGLLRARTGRADVLDRMLEANAALASWVAQALWSKVVLGLTGIRVHARASAPVDWSRRYVICANHASLFDILALIRTVPPPFRFVAKREITRWPVFGWLLRPAGQIVVDRADRAGARRSVGEAAARHIAGQVIFFVEGTRSRTGVLLPFKKGAFHFAIASGLPVLPAAIKGSFAALSRQPWWRLQPGNAIEVCFCEPVEPPSAGAADAVDQLLDVTRRRIAAALASEIAVSSERSLGRGNP
ncbi:MAG: lysophospholipid acyltransferase family protein [Candidatus Binatia bacterium]